MTTPLPFRVVASTHPLDSCPKCQRAAESAETHASVMGAVGATWNEVEGSTLQHSAEVTRLPEETQS